MISIFWADSRHDEADQLAAPDIAERRSMNTSLDALEKRTFAALTCALGWARGFLSDVLDGDFSREQVQRMYDATAGSRITRSIGLTAADLDTDWREHVTNVEQRKIGSYDDAVT